MTKLTSRRSAIYGISVVVVTFACLTIFGRSVGTRPLPWHLAWLAAFGEKGWGKGFEYAYSAGWSKQQVRAALGDPKLVASHGIMFRPGEIELEQWRSSEIWFYPSPFTKFTGPTVKFEKGRAQGH